MFPLFHYLRTFYSQPAHHVFQLSLYWHTLLWTKPSVFTDRYKFTNFPWADISVLLSLDIWQWTELDKKWWQAGALSLPHKDPLSWFILPSPSPSLLGLLIGSLLHKSKHNSSHYCMPLYFLEKKSKMKMKKILVYELNQFVWPWPPCCTWTLFAFCY